MEESFRSLFHGSRAGHVANQSSSHMSGKFGESKGLRNRYKYQRHTTMTYIFQLDTAHKVSTTSQNSATNWKAGAYHTNLWETLLVQIIVTPYSISL
jgi:hypothetical protein